MTWEDLKLQISDDVKKLMLERHVSEAEIKKVIFNAESTGDKLYQPEANWYLAKLRIGTATFYTEYSIEGNEYLVKSVYAHKAEITGIKE